MELSQNTALILGLTPVALIGVAYLVHVLRASKKTQK